MEELIARLKNPWPLLARASATLILPSLIIVPGIFACWRDCLVYLFLDFTELYTWILYLLWGTGAVFQYKLWRYKRGSGRDSELGEVGWSIGFYFPMVIIVFFSLVYLILSGD